MPQRNYWWVAQDRFSTVQHPGWIWNEGDRKPQFFGRSGKIGVRKGDKFVLAGNREYDWDPPTGKLQVYGLYEVSKESSDFMVDVWMIEKPNSAIVKRRAWVIEGKLLKGFREGWKPIESLKSLGISLPFRNRYLNPIKEAEFQKIKEIIERKHVHLQLMDKEPEYEQEVIALFIKNMKRLGYKKIIRLGTPFPDAIFEKNNGMKEEIEFELLAHGLKEHEKTNPRWRDVTYVCWQNDLKSESRYKNLRIIALSDRLDTLQMS